MEILRTQLAGRDAPIHAMAEVDEAPDASTGASTAMKRFAQLVPQPDECPGSECEFLRLKGDAMRLGEDVLAWWRAREAD